MSEGAAKRWMAARGWQPFAFQQQVWQAMAEGRSGLLHATTGAGKTYAVWLGALEHFSALAPVDIAQTAPDLIAFLHSESGALAGRVHSAPAISPPGCLIFFSPWTF